MSSISPVAIRAGSTVASCIVAAALVVTALSVVESRQAALLFFAAVALAAVVVLLVLPVQVLPALALGITVFIPDRITDFATSPVVTPATLVFGVWLLRRMLLPGSAAKDRDLVEDHGPAGVRGLRVLAIVLGAILIPLVLIAPIKQFAVGWTFTYLVAVVGPLLIGRIESETRAIRTALPWLGTVAAAYVLLQSVTENNFIYLPIYEALGKADVQHWAVYRSDGSLGHPLLAGLFFAVVLAFCVGRWLETDQRWFLLVALVNGLAIVATVSRGSYLAATVRGGDRAAHRPDHPRRSAGCGWSVCSRGSPSRPTSPEHRGVRGARPQHRSADLDPHAHGPAADHHRHGQRLPLAGRRSGQFADRRRSVQLPGPADRELLPPAGDQSGRARPAALPGHPRDVGGDRHPEPQPRGTRRSGGLRHRHLRVRRPGLPPQPAGAAQRADHALHPPQAPSPTRGRIESAVRPTYAGSAGKSR